MNPLTEPVVPLPLVSMTTGSPGSGLRARIARLEERMETMKAEYRTDIARLAEDMAKRDMEAANVAARRDAEAAKRDKENLRWVIGLFITAIVIIPGLSNSAAIANLVTLFGN